MKMRKSWLDGSGPRAFQEKSIMHSRNNKLFCSAKHRELHRKCRDENRGRREKIVAVGMP